MAVLGASSQKDPDLTRGRRCLEGEPGQQTAQDSQAGGPRTIRAVEPAQLSPPARRRHDLRLLLRAMLPVDADFNAFCLDFFPTVAERIGTHVDRQEKATLLLQLAPPGELVAALRAFDPQRFAQYESSRSVTAWTGRNPYRGLSAFQLDEAQLFFGREALTGALWQRLEALYAKPDATRLPSRDMSQRDRWLGGISRGCA